MLLAVFRKFTIWSAWNWPDRNFGGETAGVADNSIPLCLVTLNIHPPNPSDLEGRATAERLRDYTQTPFGAFAGIDRLDRWGGRI